MKSPEMYERQKARQRERYHNDPEYKKYHIEAAKAFREKIEQDKRLRDKYREMKHQYYLKRKKALQQ